MSSNIKKIFLGSNLFFKFLPFWMFLVFFKFGAGLHYSLISPLGEKILPLWIVGLLMGGGSIIQLLLDVPAGHLLDRYGYRKLLKITTVVFVIAALCFAFGFTKVTFLMSIVISTFGWLFFGPGINAYILSHAPKEHAGKFISLRDIFNSTGVVISTVAIPFMLLLRPEYMGYFLALVLLIALVMLFFSPKDVGSIALQEKKISTQHHYIKRHPLRTTIKAIKDLNPASGILLLLEMTAAIFYGTIWFVVPLVIAHQASNGLLSIGLGMFDFSIVLLGFFLGNLADRVNKRTLIFFGILLFAISGMFIGFNFSWMFLVFGFLATSGDEMAGISLWSWLHFLEKDHNHDGTVSSVINLFSDIGWAIGPIVASILYTVVGPSWTILLGAIPIFILWFIYQIIIRRYKIENLAQIVVPKKPHRARHRT